MTSLLTFSVYSLRISGDIPMQSEYLPLITLYFVLSISYTFFSLFWFILANYFLTKTYLPKLVLLIGDGLHKLNTVKIYTVKNESEIEINKGLELKLDEVNGNTGSSIFLVTPSSNVEFDLDELKNKSHFTIFNNSSDNTKCFKCNMCSECEGKDKKDHEKKDKKEKIESYVSSLNNLMCCLMCIVIVTSNSIIWTSITS